MNDYTKVKICFSVLIISVVLLLVGLALTIVNEYESGNNSQSNCEQLLHSLKNDVLYQGETVRKWIALECWK